MKAAAISAPPPRTTDQGLPQVGAPTRPKRVPRTAGAPEVSIRRYYSVAGPDYRYWSRNWNMHFGYFRRGMNPFALEPMLQEMSAQVLNRLGDSQGPLLDAGCGMGSVTLAAAARFDSHVVGVSIVPDQIRAARARAVEAGLSKRAEFRLADYTQLNVPDATFGGAFNIESACYADGPAKQALVQEMARVIRPGGRWVIADGFLKKPLRPRSLLGRLTAVVARSWAIPEFGQIEPFLKEARAAGFRVQSADDISWKVAPSFLHIIPVTMRYALARLRDRSSRMTKEQWDNVRAPLLSQLLGLARRHFGYYLIVLERT